MSKVDNRRDADREPWLREVDPDAEGPSVFEAYRKHITLAAGVVLVAFGGAIWYAYQAGSAAGGDAPLVRAPEGSARHKPDDPGGLAVPDRDKHVYDRVNGAPGAEDVQLRPGPELPLDKPEPAHHENTMVEAVEGMVDPLAERAPSAAIVEDQEPAPIPDAPQAPASATKFGEAAPSVKPAEPQAQAVAPAPTPTPTPAPAPAAAAPAASAAPGSYMLQLGAFGTQAAANAAWEAARSKFTLLGGLTRDVDVLDRDGRTLYRLRGGSFADKAAADAACGQLKAGAHPCFVTKK